jgi:predicted RNA-binding Zn ribbon-like protein
MASREPAPGALRLLQAFENTVDMEGGRDEVGSPEALRDWLVEHGLLDRGVELTAADVERAIRLREAIRSLLFVNNGAPPDPAAAATANRIARDTLLAVRFEAGGRAELVCPSPGIDQALGRLLAIAATSMTEGTWARLKACRDDVCRWAFYDHSKNRSGAWCTMDVCGNRAKARAYRRRRSSAARADA